MSPSSGVQTFRSDRLRDLRTRKGLSCEQLAILAGISPETARRAEQKSRRPSGRVVAALARALDVSVDELAPVKGPLTLKQVRQRKGLTQRAVAEAAEVSTQMVSRVEGGHYGVRDRPRWAAAYQVTEDEWNQAWSHGRDVRRTEIQQQKKKRARTQQ